MIQSEIPQKFTNGKDGSWLYLAASFKLWIYALITSTMPSIHEYCLQNIGTKIGEDKENVTFYVYGKRTCEECTYP